MLLEIAKIKATPEAQPRVSLHYPTVEEYAEALRGEAEFPPLIVFHDGTDHWLADGFHRLEAYKQCGYIEVPVDIRKGSKRDAILFSKGANSKHGLPRTLADKRRAVETLLADPEWGGKSDRWIAETAAVNKSMVARIRAEVQPTGRSDQLNGREGKDGKIRKLPERRAEASASAEATEPEKREREAEPSAVTPEPQRAPVAEEPRPIAQPDPLMGCASISQRDAVDAWVSQGAMLYERFGSGAREYMRTSWDKRLAKLEGY